MPVERNQHSCAGSAIAGTCHPDERGQGQGLISAPIEFDQDVGNLFQS